jgi:hypothetical protein
MSEKSAAKKVLSEARKAVKGGSKGGGLCWHFVEEVLKAARANCFHDQPVNKGKQSYEFSPSSPWGKRVTGAKLGYVAVFVGTKWKVETAAISRAFLGDNKKKSYSKVYSAVFSEKGHVGIVIKKKKGYFVVAGQNVSRSWKGKKDKKPAPLEIPLNAKGVEIKGKRHWFRYTLTNKGQVFYFMPTTSLTGRHQCDP